MSLCSPSATFRSIFVSVGVGLVWLGLADAAKTQKPNIIHIVGDDIGSNDFNFTRGTNPYAKDEQTVLRRLLLTALCGGAGIRSPPIWSTSLRRGSSSTSFTPGSCAAQVGQLVLSWARNQQLAALLICATHRTMILTGRYTFRYGYYDNTDADGRNGGIMLNYTLTPSDLKRAGCT